MKIHNDIEQGSPEWHAIRAGKLTASNAQAIGNAGKGLETVVMDAMARKYSSAPAESYTNADIERGNELEPQAVGIYEMQEKVTTKVAGFVSSDDGLSGCSPDRFQGDDGLVEVKCPSDVNFLKLLIGGKKAVDSKYLWQMNMQMLICERDWCNFVAYNPNFKQPIVIHKFERDLEMIEKLKIGIAKGGQMLIDVDNSLSVLK